MWYTRSLFIQAVVLFVLPFLGIPQIWKDGVTLIIAFIIGGIVIRINKTQRHEPTGTYKEITQAE